MADVPADSEGEYVLLLAPTPADARLTRRMLTEAGLDCQVCPSMSALSPDVAEDAGALLLTDMAVAEGDPRPLVEALQRQSSWSDLPIVLLSGDGADSPAAAWAMSTLGNVTVLERPVRVTTLVSALRTAIRARRRQYELRRQLEDLERVQAQVRALNDELLSDLDDMTRLHEVATQLVHTSEPGALLPKLLEVGIDIAGAQMGMIQLREDDRLRVVAHRGMDEALLRVLDGTADGWALCEPAADLRGPFMIDDVRSHGPADGAVCSAMAASGVRSIYATPLLSRSGTLVGMFCTCYQRAQQPGERHLRLLDLLARQAADFIERAQGEEALKRADRRKNEFLATLAHELRNPLAPIRSALHVMALGGGDPAVLAQSREIMARQVDHMVRLIEDLLDVSRITRGKLELRRQRIELAPALRNAVDTVEPVMRARRHELAVDIPAEPLPLHGDAVRLSQLFSNLLNNAARYTPDGGRIAMRARRMDGVVEVSVRDNGKGIPAEWLDEIFEMFVQVDGSLEKTQGGLGIGLTLVKQLVAMHGGDIEARSDGPGRGAEFVVRLPLARPARAGSSPAQRERAGNGNGNGNGNGTAMRVLVADDNLDAVRTLSAMLELLGMDVRTAADGEEAVAVAREFRPRLALIDIGMPRLNGYDAARRIRREEWSSRTMLVALTGWGQEEDRLRAGEAGFDRHYTKPVDLEDIEGLLEEAAARRARPA